MKSVINVAAMEIDSVSRREGITVFPTMRLYLSGEEPQQLVHNNTLYAQKRDREKCGIENDDLFDGSFGQLAFESGVFFFLCATVEMLRK